MKQVNVISEKVCVGNMSECVVIRGRTRELVIVVRIEIVRC